MNNINDKTSAQSRQTNIAVLTKVEIINHKKYTNLTIYYEYSVYLQLVKEIYPPKKESALM